MLCKGQISALCERFNGGEELSRDSQDFPAKSSLTVNCEGSYHLSGISQRYCFQDEKGDDAIPSRSWKFTHERKLPAAHIDLTTWKLQKQQIF